MPTRDCGPSTSSCASWTVAATELVLEPLDPDESRGIEFRVTFPGKASEYWSIKRQTTKAAGWTLALLTTKDEHGRAILADLFAHAERAVSNVAVFASTLGAPQLQELREYADDRTKFEDRLKRSQQLKDSFQQHVVPLAANDAERARTLICQVRSQAIDEHQLRDRVDFAIRKLLYRVDGGGIDTSAVRGILVDLLLSHIHLPIGKDLILTALKPHGIGRRDWAADKTIQDRVDELREGYLAPLRSALINGKTIALPAEGAIVNNKDLPAARRMLVVSDAGGGKSSELAAAVDRLHANGVPVLPLRFDQLAEGIVTTSELGRKLSLPESPALVLAGLSQGMPSALVVDQLDAISIASGRRAELWSLFEMLQREVDRFPGMSLIVGCRAFDLEHDHRLRTLKLDKSGFALIELKPLTTTQIDEALVAAGVDPKGLQPTVQAILSLPLHLSMYLTLTPAARAGVNSKDQLFNHFWIEKERRTDQRLGRKTAWTQVIDKLTSWLSANQQLSAPRHVLDDFAPDAAAMVSEHVLVLSDDRYRFFHESFFDYVFARRFAATGGKVVDLLLSSEQHLFRRAQVRQILAFLRAHDWRKYLAELEAVLLEAKVRFHVKRLVLQWMSSLPEPQADEWAVLEKLSKSEPALRGHVRAVVVGHGGWFDVLDGTGFWDAALSSGESARMEEAIWFLGHHQTLESRSARVAALLQDHREAGDFWKQYLRYVCRGGDTYHSREMLDLFLSLIADGTLDDFRPGFAVNDDWWSVLYPMSEKKPEFACEAIARWLDRTVAIWNRADDGRSLRTELDRSTSGAGIVRTAASKAPLVFVEQLLPRVAALVMELAEPRRDVLDLDPIWSFRSFGDKTYDVLHAILAALSQAMARLAVESPAALDRLLSPYLDRKEDTIAYLVLRAWTGATDAYADRIAEYLVVDPRRLRVGYASWGGGKGSAAIHTSCQAIKAASPRCSPELFASLEKAILELKDEWESQHPPVRGRKQLELLDCLAPKRLSDAARAKIAELRAKFPNFEPSEPEPMEVRFVGSPISDAAMEKMTDDQWLGALRKYAGVDRRRDRDFDMSGGEYQLANALATQTKLNPARFISLADRMPVDMPASYFDSILRGVADAWPQAKDTAPPISPTQAAKLIRRAHALPNKPCGRAIAWLIEKARDCEWPDDIIDIVAWYAVNDPDPQREEWREISGSGQPYHDGDPHHAGINSTRGSAADALGTLLFSQPDRFQMLSSAIASVVRDGSVAVRSCAIAPLLAVLNIDAQQAIGWFNELMSADSALLATPYVERFIHYAKSNNYGGIRGIIQTMLASDKHEVVKSAARQTCLAALGDESAADDAQLVRTGTDVMRKAAADLYARNVADETVGQTCQAHLKPYFDDPNEEVRKEAASAFREIAELATSEQADLLSAFLNSNPLASALEPVVRAIEDSPVQLPDLVCRMAELCVAAYRNEASDLSKAGAMVAMDLSKIVVRLYAQTCDPAIQSRCLNLIDEMERYHFMGLSDELRRLDR
jgi:hypothetical protein